MTAALIVFSIRQATVIIPVPPGMGVSAPAIPVTEAASKSPTMPASVREIPTSMQVAPGAICAAVIEFAIPVAETTMSALRHSSSK